MAQYRICLEERRIEQTHILDDIADLLSQWSFPPGSNPEILLGVSMAGYRELKALGDLVISRFFTHCCGPGVSFNILHHSELEEHTRLCQ